MLPDPVPTRTMISTHTTNIEVGSPGEFESMIQRLPRVAALRIERDTIMLGVGDTLSEGSLPIVLLDSAGAIMGRFPIYDGKVSPNPFVRWDALRFIGVAEGSQEVTLRIPRVFRKGLDSPAPAVSFVLKVVP